MAVLCFGCGKTFPSDKEIKSHNCTEIQQERTSNDGVPDTRHADTSCRHCHKNFASKYNRARHEEICQKPVRQRKTTITTCGKCRKNFSAYTNRLRHEKQCKFDRQTPSTSSSSPDKESVYSCRVCNCEFPSVSQLVKHCKKSGHGDGESSSEKRDPHALSKRKRVSEESSDRSGKRECLRCRKCDGTFASHSELYAHRAAVHHQSQDNATSFQPIPSHPESEQFPWMNEDGTENEGLKEIYCQHRHLILKRKRTELTNTIQYNFPVRNDISLPEIMQQMEEIYADNQNAFKVNLSFGVILVNIETGQYRYFTPYSNENVFDLPMLISDRNSLNAFERRISGLDVPGYIMQQRPDTKYKPVLITNITYTVYRTSFPLGSGKVLPKFITKNKYVISFERHPNTRKLYDDNLCMFRCLAYHQTGSVFIEKLAKDLHTRWVSYCEETKARSVEVSLTNICEVEYCFKQDINIYTLHSDKSVAPMYKSRQIQKNGKNIMHLNLFEDHLSYITKFKSFAHKFKCNSCEKLFTNSFQLNRHQKSCKNATKLRFPGGYMKQNRSVFEKLEELGISVDKDLRVYPWFSVFDMEAVLVPTPSSTSENSSKRAHTSTHVPVCVCLCSNVPEFQREKFILNPNLEELISGLIQYLLEINVKCKELARERWCRVFDALDELERKWSDKRENETGESMNLEDEGDSDCEEAAESTQFEPPSKEFVRAISKENVWYSTLENLEKTNRMDVQYNDWTDSDSDGDTESSVLPSQAINNRDSYSDEDLSSSRSANQPLFLHNTAKSQHETINNGLDAKNEESRIKRMMLQKIREMRNEFEFYCGQMPVCGFNSGKYDINLIKSSLAKQLNLHDSKVKKFVVKKNNNYICLSNDNLRFLDMSNYLPPGTSYDSFLVTFNVPVRKSYFCYEYLTDFNKLNETSLPPKQCFYSSLKKCNVLENRERVKFERLINSENKSVSEALHILQLSEVPSSTINENYAQLVDIWREKNMKTLGDFLQYYAELDVGPMVKGIETFQNFFFRKGLDVFKDFLSLPGVARKMLYDAGIKNGAAFSLLDKSDEDLYDTYMRNLTGGPSIIFKRKHTVGETFIRNNDAKPCRSIYGYDANSLYLWSICQDMPTGRYINRNKDANFKPVNHQKNVYAMYDWMNWLNHSENKNILHKMNNGREFRVGPYLVDGYDPDTKIIYEFLGDWYHGNPALEVREKYRQQQTKRYNRTMDRLSFLRRQGYSVRYIWETEYRIQLKENQEMKRFVNESYPTFYRKHPGEVNSEQIIEGILNEDLFGFVEVDLQVPESWDEVNYKPATSLSPQEYFKEMSPIFCTTEIPFDKIGEHMKTHAKEQNLSQKSRYLLVGGMRAEKILLFTPLLKWYISHGLRVTNIHRVIEYSKKACFQSFGKEVTDARREGDKHPSMSVMALLMKLIGNAAFGGTIINKQKYRHVKYVQGFRNSCIAVNHPRFEQLNEIDNNYFEAEFRKAGISIDNPLQLGLAILNYAKLHMLSFYYDFMDSYIDRNDFEYLEVDTDSAYFALSGTCIREIIKPEMTKTYEQNIYGNCRDEFLPRVGDNGVWFPRECCAAHQRHDQREPGLMKIEFKATDMINLNSKSYVAKSADSGKVKYSLKGVNNYFVDPSDLFQKVLKEKKPSSATNTGIAVYNNSMYSYQQHKSAFTYFYCKRVVCDDGIHTEPLDICLKPTKNNGNVYS